MKQYLLSFIVALCLIGKLNGQNFYDLNTIQTIEITFPFANWDAKLDSSSATEDYILSSYVKINGVRFDSVAVKYKGNSSYNVNNKKNPFHIELDHVIKSQDYQGYTDIKLGNNFTDPSFIREVLGYKILGNYMHAPKANFVKLYINGVYRGVYTNQEAVNKDFVSKHFYSNDGPFFKCNKPVFGSPGTPNLVPGNGASLWDSTNYYSKIYEIKSDAGWKQFIQAQIDLANSVDTLWDVDRALWMLAFNNVFVNLDSYTGSTTQNYYVYCDHYNKFNSIVWDINMCFGSFLQLVQGTPLTYTGLQTIVPLANIATTNHPLITKLLNQARYKKQYIAHMKTMLNEAITSSQYYTLGQQLKTLINNDVFTDSLKFYPYNSFVINLDTAALMQGTSYRIGIKQLMEARKNFLLSHIDFSYSPPSISNHSISPITPFINDTLWVRTTVANSNYVYIGTRDKTEKHFIKTPLYDDGMHRDSIAGDGIYGNAIIMTGTNLEYYFYAENSNAGVFSPVRAEHEYFTIQGKVNEIQKNQISINEIMSNNSKTYKNELGKYGDWIELKNNTNNDINLSGLYLSDDTSNLLQWQFPDHTILKANQYMTIWCDQENSNVQIHTNFKISSSGESLILSYASGRKIDSVSFGSLQQDVAIGRCDDGLGNFKTLIQATPNAKNNCDTALIKNHISKLSYSMDIKIFPNPVIDEIEIESQNRLPKGNVEIYDISGIQLIALPIDGTINRLSLPVDMLSRGIYQMVIKDDNQERIIRKMICKE